MKENNIILEKRKSFAVRTVKLCKYLNEKHEYILSKQLVRSGTSIGANVREAQRGQSKADFISKMNIALKESCETEYWLEILMETEYLSKEEFESIYNDNKEITKLLMSIIKTSRTNT